MPSITCPHCLKSMTSKTDLAGKKIKCPACGEAFIVPNEMEKAVEKAADTFERVGKTAENLKKIAGSSGAIAGIIGAVNDILRPLANLNLIAFIVGAVATAGLLVFCVMKRSSPARYRLGIACLVTLVVTAAFGAWAGLEKVGGDEAKGVLASNVRPIERLQDAILQVKEKPTVAPTQPEKQPERVPAGPPVVVVETSLGSFKIRLFPDKAPATAANFLSYVDGKFYDGTVFHRVVPKFAVQGGGLTKDLDERPTRPPVKSESENGISNVRGTVSIARTDTPDSATSQFFINLGDNSKFFDRANARDNVGYTVFGEVVDGMDVVDRIGSVKTGKRKKYDYVPTEPVVIISIRREEGR